MVDLQEQRIAALLLAVDCDETIVWSDKLRAFAERLDPADRTHPLASWIVEASDQLDWRDNIREFLGAYWNLPPRPFLTTEPAAAVFAEAARRKLAEVSHA